MPSVIGCPTCQYELKVPDELIGRPVKCPFCQETFTAELAAKSPPAPAEEEIGAGAEVPHPGEDRWETVGKASEPHYVPPSGKDIGHGPPGPEHPKTVWQNISAKSRPAIFGVELDHIKVLWSASDERGNRYAGDSEIVLEPVALTGDGFLQPERQSGPCGEPSGVYFSDLTYVTYIQVSPEQEIPVLDYPISRNIAPGGIDRFHVMVGAPKSSMLRVRFAIVLGKDTTIRSDVFEFHLWNPRNLQLHKQYFDGAAMARREAEIMRLLGDSPGDYLRIAQELRVLAKAKAAYPFRGRFRAKRR
jgi:hypothetical protein